MSDKKDKITELELYEHQFHFFSGFMYCIQLINTVNKQLKVQFLTEMTDDLTDVIINAAPNYGENGQFEEKPVNNKSHFKYGGEA